MTAQADQENTAEPRGTARGMLRRLLLPPSLFVGGGVFNGALAVELSETESRTTIESGLRAGRRWPGSRCVGQRNGRGREP
jgi:hypothetical protein